MKPQLMKSKTCAIGLGDAKYADLLSALKNFSVVESFPTAGQLLEHYQDVDELPELILIGPSLDPATVYSWAIQYRGMPIVFYLVPEEEEDYHPEQVIDDIRVLFGKQETKQQTVMNLAKEIQEKLLPDTLPMCEGYEVDAAIEQLGAVGGDFYWYHQRENSLVLVVGDVSGKGISAALLVGFAQELFTSVQKVNLKTMRHLNRELCLKTPDEVSVACTIVEIELSTGRFRFCNAGNPPLVALGADRRRFDHQQPSLGWLLDYPYEIFKGYLAPGEMLALYSDGLCDEAVLAAGLPKARLEGWSQKFLDSMKVEEPDDRVLFAIKRGKTQESTFDWKYALDSVLNRLDRFKPSKLFSYKKSKVLPGALPVGGFVDLPEDTDLILGRFKRAELAQALLDHGVIEADVPMEISTNQEQNKISRAVTVKDRRTGEVLFLLRGHLGSWSFESPVDEERIQTTAYLIDQLSLADPMKTLALHELLKSSLDENINAFIALPANFEESTEFRKSGFRFLDPIAGGRFHALSRDLAGYNISELFNSGSVMLMPDGKVFAWKVKEMILSEDKIWTDYFASTRFRKMQESAKNLHHYRKVGASKS